MHINIRGRGWHLEGTSRLLTLYIGQDTCLIQHDQVVRWSLKWSWFRWFLCKNGNRTYRLRGLKRAQVNKIRRHMRFMQETGRIPEVVAWHQQLTETVSAARDQRRWITHEQVAELDGAKPEGAQDLGDQLRTSGFYEQLSEEEKRAVDVASDDTADLVKAANEETLQTELEKERRFFATIESSPLTEEQARAVVCFDNRVQVVAAAGSGKTSVMVARAAYAVHRGWVKPDEILLLAFNRAAADELQERIKTRFDAAGIDAEGVQTSTFHSFGLGLIGKATGEKPRAAPWVADGQGISKIIEIAHELSRTDAEFRTQWNLYRTVYSRLPDDIDDHVDPDAHDKATKTKGLRTYGGEVVKSAGERAIADFLFMHGIPYKYERAYSHPTATEQHSQYRPDFYYPDLDVWHEHWAVDRNGNIPKEFKESGYEQGMQWKKATHRANGTTLVETTWGDVVQTGTGLVNLQQQLEQHGAVFEFDEDRDIHQWAKPLSEADLARFIRTFMSHVKSNGLTRAQLQQRLERDLVGRNTHRTRMFLDIYWKIHERWNTELQADAFVDFEDMLVQAAEHLEAGNVDPGYKLVLVDEFQDASRARARMVRGLLGKPGRYLLAVGDDWQSINRFAGADLSVMTEFDQWFAGGRQLQLTTTFRSVQGIADVASTFVQANPEQFTKHVTSANNRRRAASVKLLQADDAADAVNFTVNLMAEHHSDGRLPTAEEHTATAFVLGRYRFEQEVMPYRTPPNVNVEFHTVHSSKGLEADYVIVPGLNAGSYGFPSNIADDPLLALAMPNPEQFEHAEERRLLYVALTRARFGVTLVTDPSRPSPFALELAGDVPVLTRKGTEGAGNLRVCEACGKGAMVLRSGTHGKFYGCTRWPACDNTHNA